MLSVISIGAMAANPLWHERSAVRTGHATTVLLVTRDARIIVDPGLPPQALAARLSERANLAARDITHVFLTTFKPDTCRAIALFENAKWMLHADEREAVGIPLAQRLKQAMEREEADPAEAALLEAIRRDVAVLKRCEAAPDALADRIDLFPLPGVTPGACGLLLEEARHTTLICGDAIPTAQHVADGKIPQDAFDFDKAKASFEEAVEIADLLVPGRDNLMVNPTKRPF